MLFVKILFITSKIITDNYLQRNNKQTKDMIVKNRYIFFIVHEYKYEYMRHMYDLLITYVIEN